MARYWIVVADSARARIFEADARTRAVSEIAGLIHSDSRLPERELNSDRGGRSFDRVRPVGDALSKHVSQHEREADLFAQRVAQWLITARERGEFKQVQLSAPPAFLGLLRKHLPRGVKDFVGKSLPKNLVDENEENIASHFFGPRKTSETRQ